MVVKYGFTDQGVRLFVGSPSASPSAIFSIDDHSDHAQPEAGSQFERLADDAFSWSISHNLRISGEIRQFGTISSSLTKPGRCSNTLPQRTLLKTLGGPTASSTPVRSSSASRRKTSIRPQGGSS